MAVSLEEYFKTTFEDKLSVKMPERETDHLTEATRLLEKRREMSEVESALGAQKEEFQMKMESLGQRRDELDRKEYQLKESLLKFDKFLKENDIKRARAVKKANDEKELIRQKNKEIDRVGVETSTHQEEREKINKKLEKHRVYQKFLDKVLENSDDFHEVREVRLRYATLIGANEELLESAGTTQDRLEAQRQDLRDYRAGKNNEILGYNNQLAGLQAKLDAAQAEALKWDSQWNHVKNTAAKKTLVAGKIKVAIHNLHQLVARYQKCRKEDSGDNVETKMQLDKIQNYILSLNEIIADIHKQMEEDAHINIKEKTKTTDR